MPTERQKQDWIKFQENSLREIGKERGISHTAVYESKKGAEEVFDFVADLMERGYEEEVKEEINKYRNEY